MPTEAYRCGRCSEIKDAEQFAPSQRHQGAWCKDCYRVWYVAREGGMQIRACDWCAVEMSVTGRRAREKHVYCSRACKGKHRNAVLAAKRLAGKPERSCLHCGGEIHARTRKEAVYCSEQCNSAAHNATRKASWKIGEDQERISRAYIIERDGSRCHVCGKKCKPHEIHLDHLIPLARGGTHAPENIRVACARCNLSRRADGEAQLLLIG